MFLIQKLSILIFRKEKSYIWATMNMEEKKSDALKYLRVNARDEEWGIVITTVGYQYVSPNHAYPLSKHPDNYNFKNEGKRTLNEYQLVYITRGEGYFSSRSCPNTHRSRNHAVALPGRMAQILPRCPNRLGRTLGRVQRIPHRQPGKKRLLHPVALSVQNRDRR